MKEEKFYQVEDLDVYQKLCRLHIEVCDLSHDWPAEEKFELGSQARRASNSSPSQLAEKNDDRHVRNKIPLCPPGWPAPDASATAILTSLPRDLPHNF